MRNRQRAWIFVGVVCLLEIMAFRSSFAQYLGGKGFRLPYEANTSMQVSQTWKDTPTHGASSYSQYAYDFNLAGADDKGKPVAAVRAGYVAYVENRYDDDSIANCGESEAKNLANYVVINHPDGSASLYMHLRGVNVSKGQYVARGEIIGTIGRTGWTKCGYHLHFQVQAQGAPFSLSSPVYFEEYPDQQLKVGPNVTDGPYYTSYNQLPRAFLYSDKGLSAAGGFWFEGNEGVFDLPTMDDVVSSIELPPESSWWIIVYRDKNGTGPSKSLYTSDADLSDDYYTGTAIRVDDTISSIRIYHQPPACYPLGYVSQGGAFANDTCAPSMPTPTPTRIPNGSTPTATPGPGLPADTWYVDYFNDLNLGGTPCQGSTTTLFQDQRTFVFQDWADNAPAGGCNINFSARVWRQFDLAGGTYNFHLFADDKARLFVDGSLVVDQWIGTAHNESRALGPGRHELKIEFQDSGGAAWVNAWWDGPGYPLAPNESKDPNQWFAAFWQGAQWRGDAFMAFNDGNPLPLNKNWGTGSPGFGLSSDSFSSRYERTYPFECGDYRFTLDADDYAELLIVDPDTNTLVRRLEVTQANNQVQSEPPVHLSGKQYRISVAHREVGGDAKLFVDWTQLSACPLPPKDAGKLPWACGAQVSVIQDRQNSTGTHAPNTVDQWAWDFNDPSTPLWEVYAARDGVVADVETGYPTGSGCNLPECASNVNHVVVDHGDGTAGVYLHLAQEYPPRLRIGDRVRAGITLIGRAGSTGQTEGQQLHYALQQWPGIGGWYRPSLESLFSDPNVPDGTPHRPNFYTSGNCPTMVPTTVSLALGSGFHSLPVEVNIRRPALDEAGSVSLFKTVGQTDADGQLTLAVPGIDTGTYELYLKPRGYVRKKLDNTFLSYGQNNAFSLEGLFNLSCNGRGCAGDGNGDNTVNILDFSQLSLDFNTTNARSDFNGDGRVNVLDYTTLSFGFGAVGDGNDLEDLRIADTGSLNSTASGGASLTLEMPDNGSTTQANAANSSNIPVLAVGSEFSVTLRYDSGGIATNGIDALIDYDPCIVQPLAGQTTIVAAFDQKTSATTESTSQIHVHNLSSPAITGSGVLANLVFRVIASSPNTTNIAVRYEPTKTQDSNIADAATGTEILGTVTNLSLTTTGNPVATVPVVEITQPGAFHNKSDVMVSTTVVETCPKTYQVTISALTPANTWQVIGADNNASDGWNVHWNAGSVPDQVVKFKAVAEDRAGNGTESMIHSTILDRTPPQVQSVTFSPIQAFTGDVIAITAKITDTGAGLSEAHVFVDPSIDGSAPWELWQFIDSVTPERPTILWDTNNMAPGPHMIRLMLGDKSGNEAMWPTSDQGVFTVSLLDRSAARTPVPTTTPTPSSTPAPTGTPNGEPSLWLSQIRKQN